MIIKLFTNEIHTISLMIILQSFGFKLTNHVDDEYISWYWLVFGTIPCKSKILGPEKICTYAE